MRHGVYILFLTFLFFCSCSNEQEQKEFAQLKEKYVMLPCTDIERQARGLDSLFAKYDSLKKPLLAFIAHYGNGKDVDEVNTWLHRIEGRVEYWKDLRTDFNNRIRLEKLRPKTPEQFCSIQGALDSLRHTLQYKEPVVLEVLTHELDAIERSIMLNKEDILQTYLKGASAIKTGMKRKVEELIRHTEKDSRILTMTEVSSSSTVSDTALTLNTLYTISLTRKILVFINKTKEVRVKATARLLLSCEKGGTTNYTVVRLKP